MKLRTQCMVLTQININEEKIITLKDMSVEYIRTKMCRRKKGWKWRGIFLYLMKETYKKWRGMLQPWLEGFGIFKDSVLPNLIDPVDTSRLLFCLASQLYLILLKSSLPRKPQSTDFSTDFSSQSVSYMSFVTFLSFISLLNNGLPRCPVLDPHLF